MILLILQHGAVVKLLQALVTLGLAICFGGEVIRVPSASAVNEELALAGVRIVIESWYSLPTPSDRFGQLAVGMES